MPNISEMRESKFLKKEDVGRGSLGTISGVTQMNVAMEGAGKEMKWCLTFSEIDKPLVLNQTNIQLCAQICGSEDTDHWIGKQVVLYTDPNVSYQGKLIGGIRLRAPKQTHTPAPVPVSRGATVPAGAVAVVEDDIPFAWVMPLLLPLTGGLLAAHSYLA